MRGQTPRGLARPRGGNDGNRGYRHGRRKGRITRRPLRPALGPEPAGVRGPGPHATSDCARDEGFSGMPPDGGQPAVVPGPDGRMAQGSVRVRAQPTGGEPLAVPGADLPWVHVLSRVYRAAAAGRERVTGGGRRRFGRG